MVQQTCVSAAGLNGTVPASVCAAAGNSVVIVADMIAECVSLREVKRSAA